LFEPLSGADPPGSPPAKSPEFASINVFDTTAFTANVNVIARSAALDLNSQDVRFAIAWYRLLQRDLSGDARSARLLRPRERW
jgi:hypothetical protein